MADQHFDDGRYYAKGNVVFKSPVKHRKVNGVGSYSLGFPVCTVTDYVDAEIVAAILNDGDDAVREALKKSDPPMRIPAHADSHDLPEGAIAKVEGK